MLNQHEQALIHFERASELPGILGEDVLIGCATLLQEQGRKVQANAAFEKARRALPTSAKTLTVCSDSKRYRVGDPDIAAM